MTKKRRVRVYKKGGESFKPHMMYNPETGEGTMANIYQDHLEMKNMGYGHEPIMRKGGKPCFECGGGVYEEGGELDIYQKEGEVSDEWKKNYALKPDAKPWTKEDWVGHYSMLKTIYPHDKEYYPVSKLDDNIITKSVNRADEYESAIQAVIDGGFSGNINKLSNFFGFGDTDMHEEYKKELEKAKDNRYTRIQDAVNTYDADSTDIKNYIKYHGLNKYNKDVYGVDGTSGQRRNGGNIPMYQKEGQVNAMLNRISQSYPESGNPAAMDILQNYVNTTSFDANTQEGRDNLSYYPLVGEAADVTSALDYLMQGDIGNALMYSGAAALPFVGGKIVKEGLEAAGKQLKIDFSKAINTPKTLPGKTKPDLGAWAKHWNINTSGFANKGANISSLRKEAAAHGFDVVPYYDKNKVLQSYRIVDPATNRNVKFQEGGAQEQEQPMSLYDDKKQQFINILQEEVSEHQEEQLYNSLLEEADMIENMPYQFAKKGGQKWMQKASKSMKKRGTVGSFKKYCGGKVTLACIKKGLKSKSKAIRKKAAFAKASWKVAGKMQMGGYIPSTFDQVLGQAATSRSTYGPDKINLGYSTDVDNMTLDLELLKNQAKDPNYLTIKGAPTPKQILREYEKASIEQGDTLPTAWGTEVNENDENIYEYSYHPLHHITKKMHNEAALMENKKGELSKGRKVKSPGKVVESFQAGGPNGPSWKYIDYNIDLLQPSQPEYDDLDFSIDYENIDANRKSFTSDYTKNYYDDAGDTGGGGNQFSSFNDQESGIAGTPNYNPKLDFNSEEYDADYQSKISVGTDEGKISATGDPDNKSRLRMFGEGLGKKALLNPVAATELLANFTKGNNYKQKRGAGMTDNLVADMQYRGALGKRESEDQGALGYGINPNTGKQWEFSTGADSYGLFNAPVGQKGMQVGDVQEMSPEQIEEFISMGGQIEFLD